MKTIVLCLSAIVILVAGCSKKGGAVSDRDKFVGHYIMHDTIARVTTNFGQSGPPTYTYDTIRNTYTMTVVAVPGTSDKVVFNNASNCASCLDTATILSNIASFSSSANVSTGVLNNNVLTLSGGYDYTYNDPGGSRDGHGVGVKQ